MTRVAVLYGGSYQHHRTLYEPKYRRHFSAIVPLVDLPRVDLDVFDALVVPDRLHQGRLLAARAQLIDFLGSRRILIVFGPQPTAWLPGVRWEFRPTNFWWWLDPTASSGLVLARPQHSLFRYLTLRDVTWHQHGVFWPSEGTEPLVATEDGAAVLYVDRVSTAGTLVMTTLDPIYHFGSHFMPATERFLDGFLPWMTEELLA